MAEDRTKPSQYIRQHLSGSGNGYELDDLLSWHDRDPEWQDVIEQLLEINARHNAPGEPPPGMYRDEARDELAALAEQLEEQGR